MSNKLPVQLAAEKQVGKWVQFRTPQGIKRGILERVNGGYALIKMPYEEAPLHLLIDGHDVAPVKAKGRGRDIELAAYYAPGGVGYGPGVCRPFGGFGWGAWWFIWIPLVFLAAAALWWW